VSRWRPRQAGCRACLGRNDLDAVQHRPILGAAHRGRHPVQDRIQAHVRFRGGQSTSLTLPIPPKTWQLRQTHPAALAVLGRLLDENTDADTAEALNATGHRSGEGKPFTGRIVLDLRRAHHMPSHAERLRVRGLLDMAEITEALGVHRTTIKNWHRAGLLISPRPTTNISGCSRRTHPATRASSPNKEARSETEFQPNPHQEVQCETHALSSAEPGLPIDWRMPSQPDHRAPDILRTDLVPVSVAGLAKQVSAREPLDRLGVRAHRSCLTYPRPPAGAGMS
jgi:hypothetical protein